jgi:hypothetical protein
MKLKARNIIKGWPRSRSTVCLQLGWPAIPPFRLKEWPFCLDVDALGDAVCDRQENWVYHEAQQRMVDAYRRTGWHETMGTALQLLANCYMLIGVTDDRT